MSADARILIVNADDFGLSVGVNAGIATAHERGVVTSASLMVWGAAVHEAAEWAADHPALSLGLHLDLAEWVYDADDGWRTRYERVPAHSSDAVAEEVRAQVERFELLTGGLPTHLDSHQHVHRSEPAAAIVAALAGELDVPLREHNDAVRYSGAFYGQDGRGYPCREWITADALVSVVRALAPGITELGCHPGLDPGLDSVYRDERAIEVAALCDPVVRAALDAEGVRLSSFHNVAHLEVRP